MLSVLIRPALALALLALLAGYLSHLAGQVQAALDGLHPAAVMQAAEQVAQRP
jgi:hypothetical protein